ncbi:30S ribosomal protein S17 [Candidatus Gottesmanbacteria bacterium]|nr:30S ribosomal protein S17 [Candidatus Gottesmanbacteria bacterium]
MAKILQGKVVSLKSPKTALVEIERSFAHPLYKKRVRRTKKYKAHYEGELTMGQVVEIRPTRPISKEKFYKVNLGENSQVHPEALKLKDPINVKKK